MYHYSLRSYVNFKVFEIEISKWPMKLHQNCLTPNEQYHIRNSLVKTKYQNLFSLRRCVTLKFKKFKMAAISSFLKLRENCYYIIKRADSHKDSLGRTKYHNLFSLRRYVMYGYIRVCKEV